MSWLKAVSLPTPMTGIEVVHTPSEERDGKLVATTTNDGSSVRVESMVNPRDGKVVLFSFDDPEMHRKFARISRSFGHDAGMLMDVQHLCQVVARLSPPVRRSDLAAWLMMDTVRSRADVPMACEIVSDKLLDVVQDMATWMAAAEIFHENRMAKNSEIRRLGTIEYRRMRRRFAPGAFARAYPSMLGMLLAPRLCVHKLAIETADDGTVRVVATARIEARRVVTFYPFDAMAVVTRCQKTIAHSCSAHRMSRALMLELFEERRHLVTKEDRILFSDPHRVPPDACGHMIATRDGANNCFFCELGGMAALLVVSARAIETGEELLLYQR